MKSIFLIAACFVCSCSLRDVSDKNEFWGLYTRGADYKLSHDVFLIQNRPLLLTNPELVPPEDYPEGDPAIRWGKVPPSIQAYEVSIKDEVSLGVGDDWKKRLDEFGVEILGIVRQGTHIRPSKLKRTRSWEPFLIGYSDTLEIYGEIREGEFAGITAKISELSKKYIDVTNGDIRIFQPLSKLLVKEQYNQSPDSGEMKRD